MKKILISAFALAFLTGCSDRDDNLNQANNLVVNFSFDPSQERLDNIGQPAEIPPGNAAQTPVINGMSGHYIELAPDALTPLGEGEIIYMGTETQDGGDKAIDFRQSKIVANNETFLEIPLNEVAPGTYKWVRISVSYQSGTIDLLHEGNQIEGTLASFLGYNTYVDQVDINGQTVDVNANKLQGFWVFEALGFTVEGQAPEGAVTVPNPLFETSPIPQGSCVITGEFKDPLIITGDETDNITIDLSFSINNSFEWTEINADGQYEPGAGEQLVDMGLRGLIPGHN